MPHLRSAITRMAVVVAASSIALTGCGAAPPVGEVAPPRSPVAATPSPTPTEEAPAFPALLVPTSCDQLAPLDLVQGALAAPAVLVVGERPSEFQNYFPLPQGSLEQAGGLSCAWFYTSEAEGDLGILIDVLPRATTEWAIALPQLTLIDDGAEEFGIFSNSFGDSSSTNCASFAEDSDPFRGRCFYDILVGEYWVSVYIKGRGAYGADQPTRQRELEILNRIPSVLENLPSQEPEWSIPETAFDPRSCAGLVSLDVMRTAAGEAALEDGFSAPALPYEPFQQAASNLAGALRCHWASGAPDYVTADVVVLPGGVWVWDGISTPLTVLRYDRGVPAPIAGVGDAAAGVCQGAPDGPCELNVLIDGSWVVINVSSGALDIAALIPVANALVAAAAR